MNERKTGRIVEKSEKIIVKARDNKVSTGNEVEIVMEKVALTWMTLASVEEGAGNPSGATNNSFIGLQTVLPASMVSPSHSPEFINVPGPV